MRREEAAVKQPLLLFLDYPAAGMAAVATYFRYVLISCILAMIAAVLAIAAYRA